MAHTYNFRTRKSPVQPSPPTIQTATTRRSKATQREPASSKNQKKAVAQVKVTPASTRRSKRGRAAETSEERPRKRGRSNDELLRLDVWPQPLPTRQSKRGRPIGPSEESIRKRRRANAEPPTSDTRPGTRFQGKMGDHERWQGLQEMRGDADHVRRLVAEMEDALLRTIPLVRDVLVDIERRDARRGETLEELLGYKDAAVQIDPSAEKEHSMPFVGGRRPDETRKVKREELKAFIESFQHIYAEISGEATMTYPREDLRAVTTLCQKWSEVNPSLHDCGRSVDQQARYDSDKVLRPRPRIGADEQGYPYHDWSACQPETWPFTWLQRERLVMQQLGMRFDNIAIDADIRLLPAPLCPRRPRVFARQHEIQFSDIPQTIHSALERWYRIYGRCSECIVRAMRTFPPWIIKVFKEDELVDGNPVFANTLDDELVEWDETCRRWRHLVLDHYRWIPVQDLEERSSDSAANLEILNGTVDTPVPYDRWAWTRIDVRTLLNAQ